jgi:hypothetical protein
MKHATPLLFAFALIPALAGCWIEDFGKLFNPDRCADWGEECGDGVKCCDKDDYCDLYADPPRCRVGTPYPYPYDNYDGYCGGAGDACSIDGNEGVCVDLKGGVPECFATCANPGFECKSYGACYYTGFAEPFLCLPPGYKVPGEWCGAANECVAGATCLDYDGMMICFEVCDDAYPCQDEFECTDTGLGFSVCVESLENGGSCAREWSSCASIRCCAGLRCEDGVCKRLWACAGEDESCADLTCCGDLLCSPTIEVCLPCLPPGEECEGDLECCAPTDTQYSLWCGPEGICEVCAKATGPCASDYDCCPPSAEGRPLMCASSGVCVPVCERDADCTSAVCSGRDEVCMPGGECVCPSCSSDAECNGKKCCSGDCKDDCGYGSPNACAITTPGGPVFSGVTRKLSAVAWHGDPGAGAQMIPGVEFQWRSSNESAVAVNAATGEATGTESPGSSEVSASIGPILCGKVLITNFLPADPGTFRVLVYDKKTGRPVEGAHVVIGFNPPEPTDAAGLFEEPGGPADVHVFHDGYKYVAIIGPTGNDLVVHLPPKEDRTKAGGFTGEFDFSKVKNDAIQLGLAGASIAGDPLDLNFRAFFGEMILTHLVLRTADGAPADYDGWDYLPGAAVIKARQFGAENLLPAYRVQGEEGLRAAWGIGGGLPSKDITKLIQIIAPIIGDGGDFPVGQLVAALVPLAQKLQHAVQSLFVVEALGKIETPCFDADTGIPDMTEAYPCEALGKNLQPLVAAEKMADYENFPELALQPVMRMALKTLVTLPGIPKLQGKFVGGLVGLCGVTLPGVGLVPLGVAVGLDNPDDPTVEGDGTIDAPKENPEGIADGQILLRLSPSHGGTEGNPYRLGLLSQNFGYSFFDTDGAVSAVFRTAGAIEPEADMSKDAFPPFAEGAVLESAFRTIVGPFEPAPERGFFRYAIGGDEGEWHVYTSGNAAVTLPAVPGGMYDPLADGRMTAWVVVLSGDGGSSSLGLAPERRPGIAPPNTPTDLQTLVSSESATHLDGLGEVAKGFSRITCSRRIAEADPDYAAKCRPTDPTKIDPACNPPCEIK